MSKKSKSQDIYKRMIKQGKSKSEIIAVFISEADLTPGGANTYFLSRKKEFNTDTGEFNTSTPSPKKSTVTTSDHTQTKNEMPDSKANSGSNTDERQLYSLVFKGEDDTVDSMECSFNVQSLKTRQKQSKATCIVIKGIGKEDTDTQVYSKLKSVA